MIEKRSGICYTVKAIPHKDCVRIAQSDFSSDCIKTTQEYFVVFKANDRFALNIVFLGVLVQYDGNICIPNSWFGRKAYTKPLGGLCAVLPLYYLI